jgi:hypothetical protein
VDALAQLNSALSSRYAIDREAVAAAWPGSISPATSISDPMFDPN